MVQLEGEVVVLSLIRQFTDRALRISWFCELGEPLSDEARADAQAYMDGLGFPDTDIAQLDDWEDAGNAAESLDINSEAWEAEEQLRASLVDQALQVVSEEGLGVLLTHLSSALVDPIEDALGEALYFADAREDVFGKLALGGAQQACHGAALATAGLGAQKLLYGEEAGETLIAAHPLMLRFRLYEQGRWPVSLIGNSFNLF